MLNITGSRIDAEEKNAGRKESEGGEKGVGLVRCIFRSLFFMPVTTLFKTSEFSQATTMAFFYAFTLAMSFYFLIVEAISLDHRHIFTFFFSTIHSLPILCGHLLHFLTSPG